MRWQTSGRGGTEDSLDEWEFSSAVWRGVEMFSRVSCDTGPMRRIRTGVEAWQVFVQVRANFDPSVQDPLFFTSTPAFRSVPRRVQ